MAEGTEQAGRLVGLPANAVQAGVKLLVRLELHHRRLEDHGVEEVVQLVRQTHGRLAGQGEAGELVALPAEGFELLAKGQGVGVNRGHRFREGRLPLGGLTATIQCGNQVGMRRHGSVRNAGVVPAASASERISPNPLARARGWYGFVPFTRP